MVTKPIIKTKTPVKKIKKEEPKPVVKKPKVKKLEVEPTIESKVEQPIVQVVEDVVVEESFVVCVSPPSQVGAVEEPSVELIPKFKEAETKKIQDEALAEKKQEKIKQLRKKLENGTISDGEAQTLFSMLSEK